MNHTSVDYMNIVLIRQTASTSSFIPPACMPALIAVPISETFIPTQGISSLFYQNILEQMSKKQKKSKYKLEIPPARYPPMSP